MFNKRKVVHCENPQEWLWEQLGYLENEYIAKEHLKQCYQTREVIHPDRMAFINVEAFIFYLKQGRALFMTQSSLEYWAEPLTLYYGMMNLLKAILISVDPEYPHHTSLLRHGCSTRKRKKQPYHFLHDEIRIQKEGLFPHLLQLLTSHPPINNSYKPLILLGMLPDLSTVYQMVTGKRTVYPLDFTADQTGKLSLQVDEAVLDCFHLRTDSWAERFSRFFPFSFQPAQLSAKILDQQIVLTSSQAYGTNIDWTIDHSWVFQNKKGVHYLWVDNERPKRDALPEILVFYMLLFSLSMLARYDSPLWGEVLTSTAEGAVLPALFSLVKRRVPHLIWEELNQQKLRLIY